MPSSSEHHSCIRSLPVYFLSTAGLQLLVPVTPTGPGEMVGPELGARIDRWDGDGDDDGS